MFELQRSVLEMVAKGKSLVETATHLCLELERMVGNTICSVATVDLQGRLSPLAAPSLPRSLLHELESRTIAPDCCPTSAAAYLGRDVITLDIATDPLWNHYRDVAQSLGLKACWAQPIFNADRSVVGAFTIYYRECRGPTDEERQIADQCINLCAIALDRQRRVHEYERRATIDDLTKLRNRAAFTTALEDLSCDTPGAWAIAVLDLDNMKVVNDTFGHTAGDMLIQQVAARLAEAAEPDRAYRIGGDEFAVIITDAECLRDLDQCAARYLEGITPPCRCNGNMITPRATIGLAVLSLGDRLPQRVRQNADFALYHAKETGRGNWVRYWPGIGSRMTQRLTAIREVDAAIREDRIEAHYQPIVRIETGEIVGLEALCRMLLGGNLVAAASFHEATTDAQIATALTERMMALIAADLRKWFEQGIPFQHVSINVSSADFHSGTIYNTVTQAFDREGVSLSHVILEVTELVYMSDDAGVVQKAIANLREHGLTVALDDFGTGYASLTHLMSVPAEYIKIDKSFVDRLVDHAPSMAIVEGMIWIAQKLGMKVVAEGVETAEQARRLLELGCTMAQGYFYSRAVSAEAIQVMLQTMAEGASCSETTKKWQII